jgi:hypothetical protein
LNREEMPKLIYHDSDGVDKVLNVGAEPLLIGRATECQIQTQDAMVSRRHARIYWDGNYWIEDLGSSNGVYVGQQKVQKAPFRPGDTVTCGSLVLRLMPDTSPRLPTGALPAQAAHQQMAHDNTMLPPPPGGGQYGAPPPAAPSGFPAPPPGMQYGAPPPAAPSYAPPGGGQYGAPPPADAYAPPPAAAPARPAPVAPREVPVGPNAVLRSNPAPTAAQPSNMQLELDDERRRRMTAEQAASAAEERARAAESRAAELEASAKEANLLKRKVDQLTADMRRMRGGAPPPEESTRDEGERQARLAAEAERDRLQRTVDDLQRRLASGGGAPAGPDPETDRLRRQVDQMTSELRRLRGGQAPAPEPAQPAAPDPALADAVILLGDSLAELRASLRAANDEAGLLTAPTESVQVIREALQTAADQLESARNSLRSAAKILGV